ncbi:MAG: transcriptional repressor [Polyangiaceae bacterium]|nr:transcriptional repressor [Polyangiaceae bacterium]MCW5789128.1 transcriptional repressor [Polyangiaceae bacterium]
MAHAAALDSAGVERGLARLKALVRERNLKSSAVRDAVARAALQHEGHFTVEELVQTLRARGVEGAHRATVYRVLPLLVDAGLIHPALVASGDGSRYERAFEREPHEHITCTRCGRVEEFQSDAVAALQADLASRLGFRLTGRVHELFGVCSGCEPPS